MHFALKVNSACSTHACLVGLVELCLFNSCLVGLVELCLLSSWLLGVPSLKSWATMLLVHTYLLLIHAEYGMVLLLSMLMCA